MSGGDEIGTVHDHTESGAIIPRKRTTADDLLFAATWLEAYEGAPGDDRDNLVSLATVARRLRREAGRRTAGH